MKCPAAFPAAAALLLLGAAALAVNAEADLLPGDRLHGNIYSPGDSDELRIYLPGGAFFNADALAERGSAILPSLVVLDPDREPLELDDFSRPGPKGVGVRVKKAPVGPVGGVFTFVVTGGQGTAGRYSFRCKAKMQKKFTTTLTLPAGEGDVLPFDAPAGSLFSWRVKGAVAMDGLEAPDESTVVLNGLKGKKAPLAQNGTWLLGVRNDSGAPTTAVVKVTLKLPGASKRTLYLSPFGFGEAPRVTSVTPSSVLDDRVAEGVEILGSHFDEGAVVRLERKKELPVDATAWTVDDEGTIHADFDPTVLDPGTWSLVVENPSGGTGAGKLKVQSASSVRLPPGVVEGTEVWWLDFDESAFRNDLALLGLGSSTASTRALSEAAVRSYALFHLRSAFGMAGRDGTLEEGAVPLSFVLEQPPATLGQPGVTYNRIHIGGAALEGDPSSNPNYPWGHGPLDGGNAAYEDLSPGAGTGLGLRTASLAPSATTGTAEWLSATLPLRSAPLTPADERYYFGQAPQDAAEGARYRDIEKATRTVGKEIGTTLAHFIARSMGIADGISGASYVPLKVGEYSALPAPGFTPGEMAAMTAAAREGLPGKSKTLEAAWFPPRETLDYLLPVATSTRAYEQFFAVVGGRPEAASEEIVYAGVAGVIPPAFSITATGSVRGTAPLRDGNFQLVGGVYRFLVRYRDKETGEEFFFSHRLNLLVDTAHPALNPAEVALGQQMNAQTIATP